MTMKCKACNRKMANRYPKNVLINEYRSGKEIGYACVNLKCGHYNLNLKLNGEKE